MSVASTSRVEQDNKIFRRTTTTKTAESALTALSVIFPVLAHRHVRFRPRGGRGGQRDLAGRLPTSIGATTAAGTDILALKRARQ